MRILYVTTARIPTEKAHGIQIMHMCAAFAEAGHEVELVVPRRHNAITADPFRFYGLAEVFRIRALRSLDFVSFGRVGFWLHRISFVAAAVWQIVRSRADVVYTRDELIAWVLSFMHVAYIYEVHEGRWNLLMRRALRYATSVVTITQALAVFLEENGIAPQQVVVAPDGIPAAWLDGPVDKETARRMTGFGDEQIVMYTGHLYDWKGADVLARAASRFTDVAFVFIGGTDADIARFRDSFESSPNVRVLGRRPHGEICTYLRAADVLVLPNSGTRDISRLYTSPLKLFEYMSAARPILAADLPSIREVLDEDTAYFFAPDDVDDLARALAALLRDPARDARAQAAAKRVRAFTWRSRAEQIIAAVGARP